MTASEIALPVRPGERACCRFARPEDRERLTIAFVRAGLRRRQKVVYLYDRDDPGLFLEHLAAVDGRAHAALASGQLELRPARQASLSDGVFDHRRTAATPHTEHRRALLEGFDGLAITGAASVVCDEPGAEGLTHDRHGMDEESRDSSQLYLCHYPSDHVTAVRLAELAAGHDVDASPELAPIGRDGAVSAVRVRASQSLRLAGELDYDGAPAVAEVIAAHFHGPLRLDLADLSYVDVAGMRALRGRTNQSLTIADASEAVRRVAELLAWDTDPDVELPAAA
jgi:ABC-type transporter Mla MlaB component